MSDSSDDAVSIGGALAKLKEAMQVASGGTADPDQRRAAAMLGELTRSDDAGLARFAQRHLPGRDVDEAAVRDLRDLLLGVARLVAAQGRTTSAREVASALRNQLYARIDEVEASVEQGDQPARVEHANVAPAPVVPVVVAPAPVVAAAPARAMPSYLQASSSPWSPAGAGGAVDVPAPVAPAPVAPAFVAPPESAPITAAPATLEAVAQIEDEGTVVGDSPLDRDPSQTGLPFLRTATPPRGRPIAAPDVDRAPPSQQAPSSRGSVELPLPPLPPHLAFIDLRSHATLTAMVQVFPERLADICHQYGLVDPSERTLLDDHWYARFRRLPHEREEWARYRDHAIAHYRGGR